MVAATEVEEVAAGVKPALDGMGERNELERVSAAGMAAATGVEEVAAGVKPALDGMGERSELERVSAAGWWRLRRWRRSPRA